jgi:hypothetical protein
LEGRLLLLHERLLLLRDELLLLELLLSNWALLAGPAVGAAEDVVEGAGDAGEEARLLQNTKKYF